MNEQAPKAAETIAPPKAADEAPPCPHCGKPPSLCVCEGVEPIANKVALLILQHPRSRTRPWAPHASPPCISRTRPSRSVCRGPAWKRRSAAQRIHAAGRSCIWAPPRPVATAGREIAVLDKKGEALPNQDAALRDIEGIVVFDGTWSQAKTLWWRNAWVLKGKRIVIAPTKPSLYGKLRKEPRREGLSTLEAAALVLSKLEREPEIETTLLASFSRMLDRYKASD